MKPISEVFHGDCMAFMAGLPLQTSILYFQHDFIKVVKLTLPKPHYFYPTFSHISVLGLIECNSFLLALIKTLMFTWVAVPVVAIKLYYKILGWYKCVHSKFTGNNVLFYVIYPYFIKYRIGHFFKFIWVVFGLLRSHLKQLLFYFFGSVPARHRAKSPVPNKSKGFADKIIFTATFAVHRNFVPSLVVVRAFSATRYRLAPVFWSIKGNAALCTLFNFAGFRPSDLAVLMKTVRGAIFNRLGTRLCDIYPTANTLKCSYSVFHNTNIRINTVTQNPVVFYKNYIREGNARFEKEIAMPLFDAPKPALQSHLNFDAL